ncbi:MAG TPA: fibronectin type III domain-containing protein, partial [Pyrinomonadaceae bacterium]|nr:fibronectin type III domain-containing protein [Pyrinomonadaceae bacterium]
YYMLFILKGNGVPSVAKIVRIVNTAPTPPAAPTSLTATAASATQINLAWTDNANSEDGFRIERCQGAGCTTFAEITTVAANVTSYSNTGLTASTTYQYRVRAYNTGGNSGYSNNASATTSAPPPPAAPSSLTATAASATQINLAWTDNANSEDGFRIERCQGAGCTTFAEITTVAANVTSYSNTGLTASTTYQYRVRAYNTGGNSGYSNTASATTAMSPPAAPSNLTASAASSSQINLAWTDNSNNEDVFKIERCQGANCNKNFTQIAQVGPNVTNYSSTGLGASTSYGYRVRASNVAGDSAYSNKASATTSAITPTPPAAPSSLSATAASSSQINLAWTDNSNDEDGFKLERCQGVGCTNFAQIAQLGANTTGFANTGLAANTTYSYRVRANNTGGDSAYSNTGNATTLQTPPAAPSNATATATSSSQINVAWTDNSNNDDGFTIERCQDASCTNFAQIAQVGANTTSYPDTGLAANTSYRYRVRAFNNGGNSAYSNTANATTLQTPPNAPSNLTATAVSLSQINLAWTDNSNNEDGFKIERCEGASCSGFVQIAQVGAGVTTYSDMNLSLLTTYTYRIRAFNSAGNSGYSNTASATTLVVRAMPLNRDADGLILALLASMNYSNEECRFDTEMSGDEVIFRRHY